MHMAEAVASRSTCPRLQVGAVLVQGRSVRGTGYNGAPAGVPSCLDEGECLLENGRCIRSLHAETNLILQTDAKERQDSSVYITAFPCWRCALLLANAGISEVVYGQAYGDEEAQVRRLFEQAGVLLRSL